MTIIQKIAAGACGALIMAAIVLLLEAALAATCNAPNIYLCTF
ncbi:hypothetical protein ABIB96_001284 [Bradyrhizobium sp. LA3.X]